MQMLQLVIVALLIVAVAAFAYTLWRSNQGAPNPHRQGARLKPSATPANGIDATSLSGAVQRLRKENAQWPAILRELNPRNEPQVATVLAAIRGPHMFTPHTALTVIESACDANAAANSRASWLDTLTLAKDSMEKVTRYGD